MSRQLKVASKKESKKFWESFISSLGAEPRAHREFVGASGIKHKLEAFGFDEKHGRMIMISGDYSSRATALMRSDIQLAYPDAKVLMAKPNLINLSSIVDTIVRDEYGFFSFSNIPG